MTAVAAAAAAAAPRRMICGAIAGVAYRHSVHAGQAGRDEDAWLAPVAGGVDDRHDGCR